MDYDVVLDSELSVDALLESTNNKRAILSETEVEIMKKSPWLWHLISGELPEKNKEFYRDAGYCAFETVITMDNSFYNALSNNTNDMSMADVNIEHKIKNINKLSNLLELHHLKIEGENYFDLFFQCKMAGFEIADYCANQLDDEHKSIILNVSDKNKKIYECVVEYVHPNSGMAFIKGSYIDYIVSGRTTKQPHDIDVGLLLNINKDNYYEMMNMYKDVAIEKIPIVPLIIPLSAKKGHSFFDLDINQETILLYSNKTETLNVSTNPEKIIRTMGNSSLMKLRVLLSDEEKLNELYFKKFAHSKIYSTIRKPERMHTRLKQYRLENILTPLETTGDDFEINDSLNEIKNILARASIENSKMNSVLYNYMMSVHL